MASSSSTDRTKVTTSLPVFNGTNYREWADAIKSFMHYSGTWFLIEGYGSTAATKQPGMSRPDATDPANAAAVASWDEKNDKALGTILLYVAANLKHHVADVYTALEAWTALKNEYEKPGAMGAFVNFQKLFGSQLSDHSALGPQIDAMIAFSSEVTNAGIKIEENLLAHFIINCLPKSYAAVGSTILSASSDISKLKPGEVRGKIVEEESRRVANKTQISRVSTAPQHKKWCGKCNKQTNHSTEQHIEKGQRPGNNTNNNAGSSGSSGCNTGGNTNTNNQG